MSAILRPAKILRLVSGFARTQQQPVGPPNGQQGKPGGHAGPHFQPGAEAHLAANTAWDGTAPFQAWSLQHLQSALPVTANNDDDRKNEETINDVR